MMNLDVTTPIGLPKKMIRAMVYPNITYAKDISKDSFVQYLSTMIAGLNRLRNDLFFTIWMPKFVPALEFPNTQQVEWPLPTHAPAMRVHFDVPLAKKLLTHTQDIDVVWSHLPEATHALYATMMNLTHHRPAFFGYAHWFDLPNTATWDGASFRENLSGLLHMHHCYVNTQAQKTLVLNAASDFLSPTTCWKLEQILQVSPPAIPETHLASTIAPITEKVIVFNHRPDPYKDYPNFLRAMRQLRTQRQDFTVWVPLAESAPEPWIITDKHSKTDYYTRLRLCRVGIAPKQTYAGWSIAGMDGLMNGCPYVFYDAPYYKELHPTADTFANWEQALTLLHRYLDDEPYRNTQAQSALTRAGQLTVEQCTGRISDDITTLVQTLPIRESTAASQMIHYIRANSCVTKAELIKSLGWGRGISWTPYRRALLQHPNIYDTSGQETIYRWVE